MKNKSEEKILITLLNSSNDNICIMSLRQISRLSKVPLRTAQRAIKRLLSKGFIAQIKRANRSACVYKIYPTNFKKVATPVNKMNTKVATPVLNLTSKVATPRINLYRPKNAQITEYTEMPKEEAEIRNICNYFYSMLDNNDVYPTGIVFNIFSYYLDIIQEVIIQGLKRSEGAEQIFCEQKNSTKEAQKDSTSFGQIPLKNNSLFDVTNNLLDDYQKAYPFIDVRQAMREIIAWNYSNPSRRKTPKGILRHINNWLKAENRKHFHDQNVTERGTPISRHLTSDMLIPVLCDD